MREILKGAKEQKNVGWPPSAVVLRFLIRSAVWLRYSPRGLVTALERRRRPRAAILRAWRASLLKGAREVEGSKEVADFGRLKRGWGPASLKMSKMSKVAKMQGCFFSSGGLAVLVRSTCLALKDFGI